MRTHVILNGELLAREDAHIAIDDLGFLVGDGVFETLRVYRGVPFLAEEHVARLFASLRLVDLEIPWRRDQLLAQMRLLIESNTQVGHSGRLRVTVTRGARAAASEAGGDATLLMSVEAYEPLPSVVYDHGVDVELSRRVRQASHLHRVKSTSYQAHLLLRREASSDSVFEVLQWNQDGCLTEGSFTNVFVVDADGVLHTPKPVEGCLKGITRNAVLTIAAQTDIPTREGGLTHDLLHAAREVFLTGSLIEIVPVRRIDARDVGAECPGHLTRALRHAYHSFVASVTGSDDAS